MNIVLGQEVFYFKDNRVHSAPVLSLTQVKNLHNDWDSTKGQEAVFTPFGKQGTWYATCHGVFSSKLVFSSKEELLESLK